MGNFQKFRGDPETKLFYLLSGLIGGINTEFSDDASSDVDFDTLINFDTDKLGTLIKRNGFGKLTGISAIFNNFHLGPQGLLPDVNNVSEDILRPDLYNDNIVYMKLLRNDNNCFRNLAAFNGPFSYREYQRLYGFQNNQFHLLMITVKDGITTSWLYKCTLPELVYDDDGNEIEYDEDGNVLETLTITCDKRELPVTMLHDRNLLNTETIEFFDKIYMTCNDKGLICFDRTEEGYSYSGFSSETVENGAYRPTALEISKVGFNVLGDSPMDYINFENISTDSIQGLYLTTLDRIPILNIPTTSKFLLNILYTGEDNGFTITLNEGGNPLTFTSEEKTEYSGNGIKCYEITFSNNPTTEVEIKIEKDGAVIEAFYDYYEVKAVDAEAKPVEQLNIGEHGIVEMYNRAVYYKNDTIWFSDINNFSYIPNYNYITLPIEPTDKITKICYFKNIYVVFTKQRIYKLIGTFGSSDFAVQPINLSLGCHAGNTVVPIENMLYFASPRGLYALKSSEFRDGYENLVELDIKVKKLTSDFTLYEDELANPSIRFNGISERAYALRYKDKYLLFYNNYTDKGDYAAKNNLDVLVYNYDMKSFTTYSFKEKPTFLFLVDGAIETFCATRQDSTLDVEPREVIKYDSTSEDNTESMLKDLSGEDNDGIIKGDVILNQTSYSLSDFDYIEGSLFNSDFINDLDINMDIKLHENDGPYNTIFESTGQGSQAYLKPVVGEYISPEQGDLDKYKIKFSYNVSQVQSGLNKTNMDYTISLIRENPSIFDSGSGTIDIKVLLNGGLLNLTYFDPTDGTTKPLETISFEYNDLDGEDEIILHSGNCYCPVDPFIRGDYNFDIKLDVVSDNVKHIEIISADADVSKTKVDKDSDISWISMGIPYKAVAYETYCKFTVTKPYVKNTSRLNIPSRTLNIRLQERNLTFTIPEISGTGTHYAEEESKTLNLAYPQNVLDGEDFSVSVKVTYNIKATLSGTYYSSLSYTFSTTLPSYHITSTVRRNTTVFNEICPITMVYNPPGSNLTFKLELTDEYKLMLILELGDNAILLETLPIDNPFDRHNYRIKKVNTNTITIYCDDAEIGSVEITEDYLTPRYWRNIIIGTDYERTRYLNWEVFSLDFGDFLYNTTDNVEVEEGVYTLIDKSGNNNNGTIYGFTEIVWEGTHFLGVDSYIELPALDYTFNKGFTISMKVELSDVVGSFKLFDAATSYGNANIANKNSSINVSVDNGIISLNATSSDLKTASVSSLSPLSMNTIHNIMFDVTEKDGEYTLSLYLEDWLISSKKFNYNPFDYVPRNSCFIGKSNNQYDKYFKGVLYDFSLSFKGYQAEVWDYGTFYEFDTAYSDFNRPIYFEATTKGLNLQYPQHIKKLKHIFLKAKGGYKYNDLFFQLYRDGYVVNDPKQYHCYVDDSGQIVYDYTVEPNLTIDERVSVLGNMKLDITKLGEGNYQTKKLVLPAKGKNFKVKLYGENKDYMSLESFGFVSKLGKVKQD